MKKTIGLAALAAALLCGTANAQEVKVKIGVLSDMSSLYADIGGPGSVAAAKLAIADFQKANPNVKVEFVSGDHQNKPDVGSQIANQWFDVEKVDVIVDVPNSGVALAVSQVAANKNKLFIVSGAAASDLTGPKCSANTVHWTYDTWMLANGTGSAMVKTGGDSWFFLTADYAFGHALERDTTAAQHQRLLLVPAAGAIVQSQGDRPGERRRRHHQLDQAGGRVRHRQGRPEARRPARVRL
jgi:branched-chain amino acid transport system substrate-binding protein